MVALQETKLTSQERKKRVSHLWEEASRFNQSFWSQDNCSHYTGHAGVGLLTTPTCPIKNLQDKTTSYTSAPDVLHRYLLLQGSVGDTRVFVHVVYAPVEPTERPAFFRQLPRLFDDEDTHVVLGDLNTVLSAHKDQVQPNRTRLQGREELVEWMLDLRVIDAWRAYHPQAREFTSPTRSSRIDYALLSARLCTTELRQIEHDYKNRYNNADHAGIAFRLGVDRLRPATRAPWRCPEWVIKLPEADEYLRISLTQLASAIDTTHDNYNPGCLLDEHKRRDAIFLRKLFETKRNTRTRAMQELNESINRLQHLKPPQDSEAHKELEDKKTQLQAKLEEDKHYASKNKFQADLLAAEKCTAKFLRPPTVLHNTTIPVDSQEQLTDVCDEFRNFWSAIFKSPSREFAYKPPRWSPVKLARILRHTEARVTCQDARATDSPITANDIYHAIKAMPQGKAPGPDGLPVAYYYTDIALWSRVLEVVLTAQLFKGKMTKFQRRAQVCMLYKNGDKTRPSNYRPITLLNIDAKIGPKILARRLTDVLPRLLHDDQYGFVHGRDIRKAHLRFQGLQKLAQDSATQGGGVALDFAKAFDSVIWGALDLVLLHYGFGATFRRWVSVFLKDTLLSLLFNGSPLKPFALGAGVRQGDPLSPALFVLFIEPMLNYLRVHMQGHGVTTASGQAHTIISFADDCTGLLQDLRSTGRFLQGVEEFCAASGMRLNKEKTVIVPFKPWTLADRQLKRQLQHLGVKVLDNDESTKLLGIPYGPALGETERQSALLDSIRKRCLLWKFRARTLHGKCVILQQVILPVIWYMASVCFMPKSSFQDQVTTMIKTFMSSASEGTRSPLAEKWWPVPKTQGGLGLTPVGVSIDALQVSQLVKVIVQARKTPTNLPAWVDPVIEMFDKAIKPYGRALDILYAPVATSPNHVISRRSDRWAQLSAFWHQVLFVWHTKIRPKCSDKDNFDNKTVPLLHNADLRPYAQQQTLAHKPTKLVQALATQGLISSDDILQIAGNPPNASRLSEFISQTGRNRAYSTQACTRLLLKLQPLLDKAQASPIGPRLHVKNLGALHCWVYKGNDCEAWKPYDIKKMIARQQTPSTPTERLGNGVTSFPSTWISDHKRNKHVLPVYADTLFRLKHNALRLGYQFQHFPDAHTTCHHGCQALETPQHLFWDCPFARTLWTRLLGPIQSLFVDPVTWNDIVHLKTLKQSTDTSSRYGNTPQVALHFVRVIGLRTLWIERNGIYFHNAQPNMLAAQAQAKTMLRLHIEQYAQDIAENQAQRLQALRSDYQCLG